MGKYSYDFEINRFLLSECKGLTTKEKSTKLDDIEIKFFCSSKSIIKRVKKQTSEWKKYLQSIYLKKDLNPELKQKRKQNIP